MICPQDRPRRAAGTTSIRRGGLVLVAYLTALLCSIGSRTAAAVQPQQASSNPSEAQQPARPPQAHEAKQPSNAEPQSPATAPPRPDPDDLLYASPTRMDHIGRIVAPVMIDGKGPYRFMIDTGANYSALSPRLSTVLGLTPSIDVSMQVNGITGTARVPSASIRELRAGDLVVENVRLPVLWAPLMAGTDGILGIAGLKRDRIFVDFRANRVSIARSRGSIAPSGFIGVPGKCLPSGLLAVTGRVGNVRMQAIIDTGSERTLGNMALFDALYTRARDPALRRIATVYGATSDVGSGEVKLAPTIDVGALSLTDLTIVYGDFHIFDVWNLTARPALIVGMDVLGTVGALGIDFRRCEIYVESRYDSSNPDSRLY